MTTTRARIRLKVAARSRVAPFIVMEVLAAANAPRPRRARRAPSRGRRARRRRRPRAVAAAAGGARADAAAAIPRRSACRRCATRSPSTTARLRPRGRSRARSRSRSAPRAPSSWRFLAAFDAGDRVIVPEPGYPAYRNILQRARHRGRRGSASTPRRGFQPTPRAARPVAAADPRPDPGQPGQPDRHHAPRAELAALAAYCRARGIRLVSDEIYHGITYDEPAETVLAFDRDAIVVNSFSKYFCMTGWRLGWLVAAARPGPADRAAGAEPLHLAADHRPACGARRLRLPRRARCAHRALSPQPRRPAGAPAAGRPDRFGPGRRRLLPLCRRRPSRPTIRSSSAASCSRTPAWR